jgi:hypothetical protein
MDENMNVVTDEQMADQPDVDIGDIDLSNFNSDLYTPQEATGGSQDAFDDDGNDLPAEGEKDAQNGVQDATQGDKAQPEDKPSEAEPKPDGDDQSGEQPKEPFSLKIKYLGEEKELTEEEARTLAQKGMDYDRQRQKAETLSQEVQSLRARVAQLEEYEAFLKDLADPQALTIDDLIIETRAEVLARQQGIDVDTARARVRARYQERAAAKAAQNVSKPQDPEAEAEARRKADIEAFLREYGHVKPEDIPQEVWDKVREGATLVDAYRSYEIAQLKAENQRLKQEMAEAEKRHKEEIEAERRNIANAKLSTGSQATAGERVASDPWLDDWYSSD